MRAVALLALAGLCLLSLGAEHPPWRARYRPEQPLPNRLADERVTVDDWRGEPPSPKVVTLEQLAPALRTLCGLPNRSRAQALAEELLSSAGEFGVDPFLLGAVTYNGSHCRPNIDKPEGSGLTLLPLRMYEHGFRHRQYHYRVQERGRWVEHEQAFGRFPFIQAQLMRGEANLYFAAGLLAVWRAQHPSVDEAFPQVPHRHYVSHWVWGDRVKSARDEDRILTARRRLLRYYGALPARAPILFHGVELGPPLDGAPRVVSSGLGFVRDNGERSHRGVDVEAEFGEPVRAVAAGLVVFSGVDLPGQREHVQLDPAQTDVYPRHALGRGGRYVCIQHEGRPGPLRSCYMHLERVDVAYGAHVARGDQVGIVGRTGMKSSAPHLHFELMSLDELLDPLVVLHGHLIGTPIDFAEMD